MASLDLHHALWHWVQALPPWQSDLLRRLEALDVVSDSDIDDAANMVLGHFNVLDSPNTSPVPLAALPASSPPRLVKIISLSNLVAVGSVKDGQHLAFAPDGLTIVYGDTGSGKSSYARVLRKACRSSAASIEILPNVLIASTGTTQTRAGTAQIEISYGGTSSRIDRDVNAARETALAEVSVFDSDSASVYINEENELTYIPTDLRLIERLASFQDQIRRHIQATMAELGANPPPLQAFDPATKAGSLISTLDEDTSVDAINALADIHSVDLAHLDLLRAQVAAARAVNPAQIATLERRAEAARRLADSLDLLAACVGDNVVHEAIELSISLAALDANATELANATSRGLALRIGDPEWRAFWNAAHVYVASLQPTFQPFPSAVDGETSHCPLCQQPIQHADVRKRLADFEEYASSDTEVTIQRARSKCAGMRADATQAIADAQNCKAYMRLLLDSDAALEADTDLFLNTVCARAAIIASPEARHTKSIPAAPLNPSGRVHGYSRQLSEEAAAIRVLATSESLGAALVEIAELENRLLLSQYRDAVILRLASLKRAAQLRGVHSTLATTGLSRKISEFTETAVTEQLRTRLARELNELGADHIPIVISARGTKGRTRVSIRFNAARKVDVAYVLSEGERRAVALAFFLAEVAVSEHRGGIIFDDPVSSLDHARRSYVAKRIVEEATRRQVIVFTHDIVFMTELQAYSQQRSCVCEVNALRRVNDASGIASQALPWIAQNVSKRIGYLRNSLQELEAAERKGELEEYRHKAKVWFELLREAWERAVEEKLFKGVVGRFQPAIETMKLKTVEVTPAMTAAVEQGMTRASLWTHDQAAALSKPAPKAAELKSALDELAAFVSQFK